MVRLGTVSEFVELSRCIPEFDNPYGEEEYHKRMADFGIGLVYEQEGKAVGFKVGYDRFKDGERFYSWMGGVLPQYRLNGVASKLQEAMELKCSQMGFLKICFKTLNRHRAMIQFGHKHGFEVYNFKKSDENQNSKIYFIKDL